MNHVKQDTKVYNSGSTKMFENPVLEKLSRTRIEMPTTFYTVVAFVSLYFSLTLTDLKWYQTILFYIAGMLFFSLIEYCIHRFLFHFRAETEKQKVFQYKMHGVHHEYPKDKERLVMPIFISIFLAAMFYFSFRLVLGNFHLAFFSGFIQGYCVYLWIHYDVHRYRTPKNFFKIFWQHHSIHHYGRNDTAYAVSNPMWDYLFGTMPKTKGEATEGRMTEKYL